MKIINIACASDDHYFSGMLGTISSLLINTNSDYIYHLYIINGGISASNIRKLQGILNKIDVKSEVIFLTPDLTIFEGLPKFFYKSPLPYARLLLPDLIDVEKIIYLDSDLLFFKDISVLWELDLKGNYSAAALDMSVRELGNEYPDCSVFSLDPQAPFFNSGVMVLDLNAFRKYQLHRRTLEIRFKYPEFFKYHDQSPLNVVLYKRNLLIDQEWNLQSHCFNIDTDFEKLCQLSINFHFVTSFKPWIYFNRSPSNLLYDVLMTALAAVPDNDIYKKSKRRHFLQNNFRQVLPLFFFLRAKLKFFLQKDLAGQMDNKVAEYWRDSNIKHSFYSVKKNEITEMVERWEKRIKSKLR